MIRSLVILSIITVALTNGQYTTERRYFDDFRGQQFCAKRRSNGEDSCCHDRLDECSVPIAGNIILFFYIYLLNDLLAVEFQAHCVTVMSFVINIPIQVKLMSKFFQELNVIISIIFMHRLLP